MSWETVTWARAQRTGDPISKAVLVSIANWFPPDGAPTPISRHQISHDVEISVRSFQRHTNRLIEMGLLDRSEGLKDNGGKGWSIYTLPSFLKPAVSTIDPPYFVEPLSADAPLVTDCHYPSANLAAPPASDCHPIVPDCHPPVTEWHEPSATAVTCRNKKDIVLNNPPTPPRGGGSDFSKNEIGDQDEGNGRPLLDLGSTELFEHDDAKPRPREYGSRIPPDWMPAAIDDLPTGIRAKVKQWAYGAYHCEAELFEHKWRAEGRAIARKHDWAAAWAVHLCEQHLRILREGTAGTRFEIPAKFANLGGSSTSNPDKAASGSSRKKPVKHNESPPAAKIRAALTKRIDATIIEQFFDKTRFNVDGALLVITSENQFILSYTQENFSSEVQTAMHSVLGPDGDARWQLDRTKK